MNILTYSITFVSILEYEQDPPVTLQTTTATTTIDHENYADTEEDNGEPMSSTPSPTYTEQNYQSLFNRILKERPITRRRADYNLEDPTLSVRQK